MTQTENKSYQQLSKQYSSSKSELLKAAEENLCRADWHRWLTKHFIIKDKSGNVRPMSPLKQSQLKLLKLYEWCKETDQAIRIIVLKARKTGISTLIEGLLYLETMTRGVDSIVIAHDKPTAEYVFSITNRFYNNYSLFKPRKAQASVRKMTFKNQEGMIMVETANNIQAGTGLTPHFIHGSECSKWHKGSDTAVSLFQSIGDGPETAVILESTANGFDSLFHPYWENADKYCHISWIERDGDIFPEVNISDWDEWNGYLPYFISWFDDPEYKRDFRDDADQSRFSQTLNDAEKNLQERYQVKLEQLNWYRWILKDKCQGDLKIRRQEYPSTPEEAFVSSGRPYLDHDILDLQPLEEGRRGYLIPDEKWGQSLRFISDKTEALTIFRDPQPNHRYAIGIDTAEGILPEGSKDPDRSVACVLDLEDGCRQVAVLAGHISEEPFAEMVTLLGQYYNMAFMVPEVSGYGTHVCIYLGNNFPRHLLYHRTDFLTDRPKRSRQIGWRTTITSRPILLGDLKTAISERSIIVHSKDCLQELKRLEYNPRGKVEGSGSSHDDQVFALALALQGVKAFPVNLSNRSGGLKPFGERGDKDSIDPVTGY